ncbi:hemerythrin domain-containing protein [Acuticoccus kandeliae]|uniref:hemerythrin domain-containing protein n=1 Tax=Acuticoccus kandeliae TaxID=2073160 RepID=UPI000D3E3BD1|nr:hemerythrin domain-containing protein [Acuticoccus kandeliae]
MKRALHNLRCGSPARDPTDLRLLENPLDFIKEGHMRMRAMCEVVEMVAASEMPDPVVVSDLLRFLDREVGLLIQDEDDDLRELLAARCEPEDDIETTLRRVEAEHRVLKKMIPALLATLRAMHEERRRATPGEAELQRVFASLLRRHLIVENAIVLPMARARLTENDLAVLRSNMIRRREEDL